MKHPVEYCKHCELEVVVCKTCGNNTCNGGYGTLEDGTECPDCESAHDQNLKMQDPEWRTLMSLRGVGRGIYL